MEPNFRPHHGKSRRSLIGMAMDAEPARTLGYIEGRITELAAAVQDLREGLQEVNRRIEPGQPPD
jgi:hypothetical protein